MVVRRGGHSWARGPLSTLTPSEPASTHVTSVVSCYLTGLSVLGWKKEKASRRIDLHLIIDGRHYVSRCSVCCVSVCVFMCMCDVLYVKHLVYLFAPASYGLFLKYTRRSIYVIRGHSVVNNTLKHTL